ncbi:cysteine proteinase [Imleria badia]|nr:cysteine proteinase [Imleria badia]
MPEVAILHPTSPGQGFGSSHSDKTHFHLPDNTRNHQKPPPEMHNGSVASNDDLTVAELKEKAKEDVRKAAKGVSAMSLIKIARSQSQQARIHENQGDLKAALGPLLRAGILTHMFMNSGEFMAENKPGRHGVLYKEFVDFQKTEGSNLTQRVQAIEAKLTDLEKSAATDDNADAGPSRRVGTSIADRVKKLNDAGLAVDTSKPTSREFPIAPSSPLSIPLRSPEPIRTHKLSPSFVSSLPLSAVITPSNNSSTTSSPHAVVPPSSLGPPSPTSSGSSSPPLAHATIAEFSQAFPSIDELDEFTSRFPSVPVSQPTGSSSITHRSSISQSNGINGAEMSTSPQFKQFPSLSIDPGPRPSSTPITPTVNAFISCPASPTIAPKPSINSLASSPLSSKTSPAPEKPAVSASNTIIPELLREYLDAPGLKTLVVDIRTREEFDNERIKADAIVCLEPSVLARPSVTAASLEDSLVVAPREEWVLFQNRDKFDLVVLYDASSETYDVTGPLSAFVRAVFADAFRKYLRHTPVLLVGGLQAWREMFSDELVRGVPGGRRASPNSILENGISSTSGAILASSSIPDPSRNRSVPGSPHVNGALTEKRLLELTLFDDQRPLGKAPEINGTSDGPASLIRRQVISKPPSSISHSHSQSESISQSPRQTLYSFSIASPPVTSASSFSPTPSSFIPVSLPPQASINPSPLARRRSEYMNGSTGSGFTHRSTSIDYPDLQVIRPPPPAATPASERQDSRSRLLHSPSYSVSAPCMNKAGPKPPTIQSDYPVVYWSDVQTNRTGLKNLGNTCYMNATIQCLSATVPFARFFTDGRWRNAVNMVNPLGTKGNLAGAFAQILREMAHSELPYLNPLGFRKSICTHAVQFSGSSQHDSQEFLTFLLDGLHEDLNRVLTKPNHDSSPEREAELEKLPQQIASEQEWEIYRMRNDSLIVDYFQGQFRNRMECLTCHHTSTTYNSFMYLSLPIPNIKGPSKAPLYSCLDTFVKEEVLEKSEAWHCPKCKALRSATKILSLSRLPPVLLIHLKRFSVKGPFTDKIETVVDFPLKSLDLTNYMPPPFPPDMRKNAERPTPTSAANDPRLQVPPYKYDLYGVTNHFGSLSNGHYTAFVASPSSPTGWVYCDDSRITPIEPKEAVGRPAYVLYYKRIKT